MPSAASTPFQGVPTAPLADACVRLGVPLRVAPVALLPIIRGSLIAGPAVPVTHVGSVDVLLEAIDDAPPGGVLVVDNGGRHDEACVGDLIALEAQGAQLAGIIIWGRHRDTTQIVEMGMPLWSLGAMPPGPRRVPPAGASMRAAWLHGVEVRSDDIIAADDDGVLVVAAAQWDAVVEIAQQIQQTEIAQAERMRRGDSLRAQLDFGGYRQRQRNEPGLSLRQYLAERGGAIEV